MLEVKVVRTVTRPEYRQIEQIIRLNSDSELTPATARRAVEIAFGTSLTATEVWGDDYGYKVYANSTRKIYPSLY